jgi:hypothetical protein
MLRKSIRAIDQASAKVFEHPVQTAKVGLAVGVGCVVMEKVTEKVFEKVDDWRLAREQGEMAVSATVETEDMHDEV